MAKHIIVRHTPVDNQPSCLFQMEADDFRLSDPRFAPSYERLANVVRRDRVEGYTRLTDEQGQTYRLFSDWSLRFA